jgi:ABC-type amino acid transport substrate-binding protein
MTPPEQNSQFFQNFTVSLLTTQENVMKKTFMLICLGVLALSLVSSAHAGKKIVLATLDWEPYIGASMEDKGYVAELVKEAYKRKGYDLQIEFMPWARVIKMAKIGKYDGYFPEYYAEELKKDYEVSSPFPGGPLGFYKRKDKPVQYNSLKDLVPYRIGVVRGYVNTKEFDDAAYLKKEEATDDLTNFKKLLKNRLDLVVSDKFVGKFIVSKNLPAQFKDLEFLEPPLENKDLFVCISHKATDYQEKISLFNEGLKEIIDDGTVTKILKKHGF